MAHWIFQSVRRLFDLPGALKEAPEHGNVIAFLVTKHGKKIMPGDTVYVCFGGPRPGSPGLHATATVQTCPSAAIDPEVWQSKYAMPGDHPWDEKAGKKAVRTRLKIERYLEPPVARSDLYALEELKDSQFVKTHGQGTNFSLTPEQAKAIEELIA